MNNRITRRKVAKQFIIAFELLLEWIEQKEHSYEKPTGYDVKESSHRARSRSNSQYQQSNCISINSTRRNSKR